MVQACQSSAPIVNGRGAGKQQMQIRPIRNDKDRRTALAEIEACWGAPEGTEAGDRLDVLLVLVDIHEAKRWPIEIGARFDPVDVLNYAIEELGHTQAELAELL